MKKQSNFRDLSVENLHAKYDELSKDIFQLKSQRSMEKQLEKPHLLKEKRKDRARVLTALQQKKLEISN